MTLSLRSRNEDPDNRMLFWNGFIPEGRPATHSSIPSRKHTNSLGLGSKRSWHRRLPKLVTNRLASVSFTQPFGLGEVVEKR
jgi:hypothetical protein